MQKNGLVVWMDQIQGRIGTPFVFLVSIALAICSIIYHKGGAVQPEVYTYLPYYLSDKPLLNKIYDSKVVGQNFYQARELSYFFDYLDCKFILLSVKFGHPHFLSAISYTFLLATGMLIWQFSTRDLKLPPAFGLAFVILYWTSPSIFMSGIYFRSSKAGVTFLVTTLFILMYRQLADENRGTRFRSSILEGTKVLTLSFAMTLFDRQGVYFIGMAIIFLVIWNYLLPQKKNRLLLSSFAASLILNFIYNYLIGPFLTQLLNGYQPDFSYQQIWWSKLIRYLLFYIWAGVSLYIDTLRFMLGNIPLEAMFIIFLGVTAGAIIKIYNDLKTKGKPNVFAVTSVGLFTCNVLLLIGLNALMVLRHTPIFDQDVRRTYYWMPEVAVLLLTILLVLGYFYKNSKPNKTVMLALAILAISGNIYAIPNHKHIMTHGHMESAFEYAPHLLQALDNINNEQYDTPTVIKQDALYHFFEQSVKQ